MVVYVVCFDLRAPNEVQKQQISFWLEFLSSALPKTSPSSNPRWTIMLAGLREDIKHPSSNLTSSNLPTWQKKFPHLPLFTKQLFTISTFTSKESVRTLLDAVNIECNRLFDEFSIQIPSLYLQVLSVIQNLSSSQQLFTPVIDIQKQYNLNRHDRLDIDVLQRVLRYLHNTGHVVILDK